MQAVPTQVLIIDDDDFALYVLDDTLVRKGYTVVAAHNGREALEVLRRGDIRLVITDWDMPEMNGVDFCRSVRREDISGYVYIIMLTGREGAKQRMEGLCAGADAFLSKPFDPEELLVCLKTAERILSLETRDLALFAMAKLAESRDTDTGAHIERVQSYSRLLAGNLSPQVKSYYGVDDEYIRLLYQTSPLHDLGKVGIPDVILLKPGKLSADEFEIMKTHAMIGAKTLDAALQRFPNAQFLRMAREIAATHHEKFDGSGYPHSLAGDQIPLCGRIVAVADVYDALTSRRVYKEASTHDQAKATQVRERGNHFDPQIVDAFLRAEAQILAVRDRLCDEEGLVRASVPIPDPPPPSQRGPSASKILIVEDDPALLEKLVELLAATGEPIFTATDGQEALRIVAAHDPRVILSDWVMPKIEGDELCRRIHGQVGSDLVHFIMLTAHSDRSRLLEAYDAGVDDFISKPFDQEELLARVRAGIRAVKLHDELIRKATGSQATNAQLVTLNSQLKRLSITDELTGLFNRRHAMSRLEEQWELVSRYGRPLTVAMIDIDHFKQINDLYGHDAGDAILREMAKILRDQTRGTDVVCRVGGDEFLIIFPLQTPEEANVCAERCRHATASKPFEVKGHSIALTVSIGLATRVRGMSQFPDLLNVVDLALFAAKHAGRNLVRIADQSEVKNTIVEAKPIPTAALAAPADSARAVIDLDAVLERCGGDPKFATAVVKRFQSNAPSEVVKIEQALAAGDAATLARAAHSLKSMTAYMSADAASALARQIEMLAREQKLAQIPPLLTGLKKEIASVLAFLVEHGFQEKLAA